MRDREIYILQGAKMVRIQKPTGAAWWRNFVIQSRNCGPAGDQYGDWSGFQTLPDCAQQFPQLEKLAADRKLGDGYYRVVER